MVEQLLPKVTFAVLLLLFPAGVSTATTTLVLLIKCNTVFNIYTFQLLSP